MSCLIGRRYRTAKAPLRIFSTGRLQSGMNGEHAQLYESIRLSTAFDYLRIKRFELIDDSQ